MLLYTFALLTKRNNCFGGRPAHDAFSAFLMWCLVLSGTCPIYIYCMDVERISHTHTQQYKCTPRGLRHVRTVRTPRIALHTLSPSYTAIYGAYTARTHTHTHTPRTRLRVAKRGVAMDLYYIEIVYKICWSIHFMYALAVLPLLGFMPLSACCVY